MMPNYDIRPVNKTDEQWVDILLRDWWAGSTMVTRGQVHHVDEYPAFVAMDGQHRVGLITYHIAGKECEITSLNSLNERHGIGTALVEAVKETAVKAKCKKLIIVTTNDNTAALHFWQKRGFRITAVRLDALEETRKLKPGIPLTNDEGIPIKDEIELEMKMGGNKSNKCQGPGNREIIKNKAAKHGKRDKAGGTRTHERTTR